MSARFARLLRAVAICVTCLVVSVEESSITPESQVHDGWCAEGGGGWAGSPSHHSPSRKSDEKRAEAAKLQEAETLSDMTAAQRHDQTPPTNPHIHIRILLLGSRQDRHDGMSPGTAFTNQRMMGQPCVARRENQRLPVSAERSVDWQLWYLAQVRCAPSPKQNVVQ